MKTSPKVLSLLGTTASGKTALVMALAERIPVSVISVDSVMVYRGMDIGSAQPTPQQLADCPHALVDVADPFDPYTVGRFVRDAERAVQAALAQHRLPVMVGGTMMYHKAFQKGLAPLPPANRQVRADLQARARTEGWAALHAQLQARDPRAAARVHPQDAHRIQRAWEVMLSGSARPDHWATARSPAPYHWIQVALWPQDRALLRRTISERFDSMWEQGLEQEVRALCAHPAFDPTVPAMQAVGYKQVVAYLQGQITRSVMREQAVVRTAQLAKRQITWIRHWHAPLHVLQGSCLVDALLDYLQQCQVV